MCSEPTASLQRAYSEPTASLQTLGVCLALSKFEVEVICDDKAHFHLSSSVNK